MSKILFDFSGDLPLRVWFGSQRRRSTFSNSGTVKIMETVTDGLNPFSIVRWKCTEGRHSVHFTYMVTLIRVTQI
jgi:hypothetical protein